MNLSFSPCALAQLNQFGNVLNYTPPRKIAAHPGTTVESSLPLQLRPGYHVNSNTPPDQYLIPLRLTWNPGVLQPTDVTFPSAENRKYAFSEKPLSVYGGEFALVTRFKVPADAPAGPFQLTGKLRYQACNDQMCLPPKTLDVTINGEITK